MKLEDIIEMYSEDELLKADGFDDAVIGVESNTLRLVYDVDKMVDILIKRDGMTGEDAMDYLNFNVISAYVGVQTPIYIQI